MATRKRKTLRQRFLDFDDSLAAKGVPPLTPWWRAGIGRWLDAYERRQVVELWACVGRGAAKSTALYKLALFFALFGSFDVPPGEVHYAIVLSRLVAEAAKGIAIIDRWLTLLGIEHHLAGDVIELGHLPRGIRVVAASVAATSGWRAFFVGRDERSKWSVGGSEVLDADEVDTSSSAMTATHELAPSVTTGSAWGMAGSFYEIVTAGSDPARVVLGPTPTWIAAPHITEESTHRKERHPKRWRREYECVFSALTSDVFEPEDIERLFRWQAHACLTGTAADWGRPFAIVDPAGGGATGVDAYTFATARWVTPHGGEPVLVLCDFAGVSGKELRKTTVASVVRNFCATAKHAGAALVVGDQRDAALLKTEVPRNGLRYSSIPWTNDRKQNAVETLQTRLREGTIVVGQAAKRDTGGEAIKKLRAELFGFQEKHAPSGALTYAARGGSKDDYVALLLTALMAVARVDLRAPRPRPMVSNVIPFAPHVHEPEDLRADGTYDCATCSPGGRSRY